MVRWLKGVCVCKYVEMMMHDGHDAAVDQKTKSPIPLFLPRGVDCLLVSFGTRNCCFLDIHPILISQHKVRPQPCCAFSRLLRLSFSFINLHLHAAKLQAHTCSRYPPPNSIPLTFFSLPVVAGGGEANKQYHTIP